MVRLASRLPTAVLRDAGIHTARTITEPHSSAYAGAHANASAADTLTHALAHIPLCTAAHAKLYVWANATTNNAAYASPTTHARPLCEADELCVKFVVQRCELCGVVRYQVRLSPTILRGVWGPSTRPVAGDFGTYYNSAGTFAHTKANATNYGTTCAAAHAGAYAPACTNAYIDLPASACW